MGYAAARGGLGAIAAAEEMVVRERVFGNGTEFLAEDQLVARQRLAVDRVMAEGGLWAPQYAARAIRQAEGDLIEAAQLVRSHRSTLPRLHRALTAEVDDVNLLRRVVPAYRQPPGPQLLGRTVDYVGRFLEDREPALRMTEQRAEPTVPDEVPRRMLDVLRELDLLVDRRRTDDPEPYDVTRQPVRPGVPRSAHLATMARAETGALVQLWYRNVLGPDGYIHEVTLGEVRHVEIPVRVRHPRTGRPVCIGHVRATETEAIEDLNGADESRDRFDVGYGLCLGHNERKAIAMANLDVAVSRDSGGALEQSILLTTDGLDASGFLEHLKLPHYVTFRSMVERKLAIRSAARIAVPVPVSRKVADRGHVGASA